MLINTYETHKVSAEGHSYPLQGEGHLHAKAFTPQDLASC